MPLEGDWQYPYRSGKHVWEERLTSIDGAAPHFTFWGGVMTYW
jgi:hypothetical protein